MILDSELIISRYPFLYEENYPLLDVLRYFSTISISYGMNKFLEIYGENSIYFQVFSEKDLHRVEGINSFIDKEGVKGEFIYGYVYKFNGKIKNVIPDYDNLCWQNKVRIKSSDKVPIWIGTSEERTYVLESVN